MITREQTKKIKIGSRVIGGGNPGSDPVYDEYQNRRRGGYGGDRFLPLKKPAARSSAARFLPWKRRKALQRSKSRSIFRWWQIFILIIVLRSRLLSTEQTRSRINPGNIGDETKVRAVVEKAKAYHCAYPGRRKQRFSGKTAGGKIRRSHGGRPGGERTGKSTYD